MPRQNVTSILMAYRPIFEGQFGEKLPTLAILIYGPSFNARPPERH